MRTRSWSLLAAMVALACTAGCAGTEELTCFEGACAPGTCDDSSGTPTCTCPAGYTAGPNLTCDSDLKKMGESCVDSTECETGWCLRYSDGTGYCSKRDCLNNEGCVNYAEGETALMCCVDVGGDFKVCLKIDPGYVCGNQDKTCGQSCAGQLDSACNPDTACLTGSSAYCSHACVTDADCNDCQNEDPDVAFLCQVIGGGDSYCIALIEQTCTASSQCDPGEVCTPYIDAVDPNKLTGYCGKRGDLPAGAVCDEEDDQCAGMCINEHCSEVCETDGDCPEQNTCMSVSFCKTIEGTGECAVCTESFPDIKMCIWYPLGTQPAGAPCDFGSINAGAGDCQAGMACLGIEDEAAACTTAEDCLDQGFNETWNTQCVIGICGNPNHCGSSFCSPKCAADGTCEEGFDPAPVGSDCYCIPGTPPGTTPPGGPCPFSGTNADADNCVSGAVCLGIPADTTSPTCAADAECVDQGYDENWNPDCVTIGGQGYCGASFCSEPCDANGGCEEGFEPISVGTQCYCAPTNPPGTSIAGEPCPFGSINSGSENCISGLACLGIPADATETPCPNGDADCLAFFDAAWNPDCQNGGCGASFCSPECDANGACLPGFLPQDVEGTCYCIPAESGEATAGERCALGNVNSDADACAAGLYCVGAQATSESPSCSGLDSQCEPAFPLPMHPDCADVSGWGRCGYSYCAAMCDGQGACAAGFTPTTISGQCYCAPDTCVPSCTGRVCGTDFCGGSCGTCTGTDVCNAEGQCEACVPDCGTRECGMDPVCGTLDCGTCIAPAVCGANGMCCTPDCNGKECGDDGCGGSCGECTAPETCQPDGTCACVPDCGTRECGMDPVCGTLDCGTCTAPAVCGADGMCCTPDCNGKVCGDDGCGGSCGECTTPQVCDASGQCVDP